MNSAEAIAEGAKLLDLYYAGVQVLVDLGVPLPQIEGPTRDIEITATRPSAAVAEPEKEADSGSDTLTDSLRPAKPKITVPEAF